MTVHQPLAPGRYKLRVEDYQVLAETGAFGDTRTELIEGEVFVVSPQFLPHGFAKTELYDQLRDALRAAGSPLRVMSEISLEIAPGSMPAPDLLLTSEPRGRRAAQLGTVPLLVEVADSTLAYDLGEKLELYARAGVPEYWVADINGRVLHRMWVPIGGDYSMRDEVRFGTPVISATIPQIQVETAGL